MLAQELYKPEKLAEKKEEELSLEEKKEIDELIAQFGTLNPYDLNSYEERKIIMKKISSVGRKALPYLRENFSARDQIFYFSSICESLAEEEDLELMLDLMKDEKVSTIYDTSAFGQFERIVSGFVCKIRQRNSQDERLQKVAEELADFWEKTSERTREDLWRPIALTGTDLAKKFLEEKNLSDYARKTSQEYAENLDNVPSHLFKRENLLLPSLHLVSEEDDLSDSLHDSYEDDYWEGQMNDRFSQERAFQDETEYYESMSGDNELYDYTDLTIFEAGENLDASNKLAISRANSIIDHQKNLEKTIESVSRLTLFNALKKDNENGAQEAMRRTWKMHREELLYADIEELPTIGIEVECGRQYLNPEKIAILNKLRINNTSEIKNLWEVNPDFSYSPYSQARMLQELVKFGAIPKEIDENGKSSINKNFTYSLHVNFGVPADFRSEFLKGEKCRAILCIFSDVATYAFVSPKRIKLRKTPSSFMVNSGAEKSKKHKVKNKTNIQDEDFLFENEEGAFRFEYRANEFRDYTTFRMLAETQALAAMLFSCLKLMDGKETNELEKSLAVLWVEFSQQFKDICSTHGIEKPGLADKDENLLQNILNTTSLQFDCRKLVSHFSRTAIEMIKKEYKIKSFSSFD